VRPLLPAFAFAGVGLVAAELIWQESFRDWLLGLALGGLIGLWIAIADSPPAHIEQWLRGAQGERMTERALRPLRRSGWSFVHDVDTNRGNRDHVAVGPAGVFLIETKRPDGAVCVDGDQLRVQRLDDPDQHYTIDRLGARIRAEAARLSEELAAATGHRCWVQPVVVLWAPFAQRTLERNRVTYLQGDELAAWLRSRARTLSRDRCSDITLALSGPDDKRARAGGVDNSAKPRRRWLPVVTKAHDDAGAWLLTIAHRKLVDAAADRTLGVRAESRRLRSRDRPRVEASATVAGVDVDHELAQLRQRLAQVMQPGYIDTWLPSPIPALEGETPGALIARGGGERVSQLVAELESPGVS
jgi:Nuclease-related domain